MKKEESQKINGLARRSRVVILACIEHGLGPHTVLSTRRVFLSLSSLFSSVNRDITVKQCQRYNVLCILWNLAKSIAVWVCIS